MARWAGVQNVSRPIVMCHEMSQMTPTTMLVDAKSTAGMCHGIADARALAARAAADCDRTVTPIRAPPEKVWRPYVMAIETRHARRDERERRARRRLTAVLVRVCSPFRYALS